MTDLIGERVLMVSAQSLTIMRIPDTIYSTNVDDDEKRMVVHEQLRTEVLLCPLLTGVLVSTNGRHSLCEAHIVTSRLCVALTSTSPAMYCSDVYNAFC